MSNSEPVTLTKEQRATMIEAVAKAFRDDDPAEYADETLAQTMESLSEINDAFILNAYKWFVEVN
jgi:hypothetical protein